MARGEREEPQRGAEGTRSRNGPATSYYDLYPERKRTGPYIPKHALVEHDNGKRSDKNKASGAGNNALRRSLSGSQLVSHHNTAIDLSQPPKSTNRKDDRSDPIQDSITSPYASSSIAHSRDRPFSSAREPVKSIAEIIRSHSSSLLAVPPSQRGPQRSVSWSAFGQTRYERPKHSSEGLSHIESDADSAASEDSVERETRRVLHNTQDGHLERTMSQLSVQEADLRSRRTPHIAVRKHGSRTASPDPLSLAESRPASSLSNQRGLTRCVYITIPGVPDMQASFADVGSEGGHPVLVLLGLGASRHLVGLYDGLAAALGLRLVCIDRWGIGRTDQIAAEARTILGWSFVVEQVADLLGIDKFSIIAHSAGAPFAAAVGLLFPHRVQGPLHLLAPWTGLQQDSGYRWLRYVPDGVIKTAQAAEWKIQSWKLGKEGLRSGNRTPLVSTDEESAAAGIRASNDSRRGSTMADKQRQQRPLEHTSEQHLDSIARTASDSARESGSREGLDDLRPIMTHDGQSFASMEEERETALDLLKASHAESARGLVDDLNLVLGKRPWGFSYADVQIACEVWHGSKDERIPVASSTHLAKEMRDCRLHVVEGASHGLMTNSEVVIEVFESIRKYAALSSDGENLRSRQS
ncbi:hypothetical protein EX895_000483 [Sporisorium graminicola]|uniref:AB hydrolase-1 domain-containing protein n=1 Tax=Sporisorium graminicola TaxID=280036 RepID=A0A4U7L047_9BASI|nr:hypothetical protein EX895_000483 [Sporisorium graminicola]TKY90485.1 hypothetical protein EX895_000483 [Sporisorium graminicola]